MSGSWPSASSVERRPSRDMSALPECSACIYRAAADNHPVTVHPITRSGSGKVVDKCRGGATRNFTRMGRMLRFGVWRQRVAHPGDG